MMSSSGKKADLNMTVGKVLDFIRNSPIRIAVFGLFSTGKSTFINAMIGEEILSVAVTPTTAVPVYIKHGREFNIFVHLKTDEILMLFEEQPPFWAFFVGQANTLNTLKRQQATIKKFLHRWTTENQQAEKVDHISLVLPLDWLKSGIEIVDTPGLGTEFTKHQQFTEAVSRQTDIAILLLDAHKGGVKRTEFEYMNTISEQVYNSSVVLNKLDLLDLEERDDVIDFVRNDALPKHWYGAVPPQLFELSAKAMIDPETAKVEKELVNHFGDFIKVIVELIALERGKILLFRLGNPEKDLFNKGKALEFEGQFDLAYKIYYDLLAILELAKLNTQPALDGISRCKANLTQKVNILDAMNGEINRADECEKDDPDSALSILQHVHKQLKALRLNSEADEIDLRINALDKRICIRDEALREIANIQQEALKYFNDGDLIRCTDKINKVVDHIPKAELSFTEQLELRNIIKRYTAKKDDAVEKQRIQLTDEVNDYLNNCKYESANRLLPELEKIIPLLVSPNRTSELVIQIKKVCNVFEDYKQLSRYIEKECLPILKQVKVKWIDINKYNSDLTRLKNYYITLFSKYKDLELESESRNSITVLTIDEKIEIAEYYQEYTIVTSKVNKMLTELHNREAELQQIKFIKRMNLKKAFELFKKYPDHNELHKIISSTFELSLKEANKTWFRGRRIQRLVQIALNNSEIGFFDLAEKAFGVANQEAFKISDYGKSVETLRFITNKEFLAGIEKQSSKPLRNMVDRICKSSLFPKNQSQLLGYIAVDQAKLGLKQDSVETYILLLDIIIKNNSINDACLELVDIASNQAKNQLFELANKTFLKATELSNKLAWDYRKQILDRVYNEQNRTGCKEYLHITKLALDSAPDFNQDVKTKKYNEEQEKQEEYGSKNNMGCGEVIFGIGFFLYILLNYGGC